MIFEVEKQYLTHLYKLKEENKQMAKLTGYYAVAVIEEVTCCCKKDYYYAVFDDGNRVWKSVRRLSLLPA